MEIKAVFSHVSWTLSLVRQGDAQKHYIMLKYTTNNLIAIIYLFIYSIFYIYIYLRYLFS